jgi:hypothetical protein
MTPWTRLHVRSSRIWLAQRATVHTRCGSRDAGGAPPAKRRRCPITCRPAASAGWWLAGQDAPGLQRAWQALAFLGSWWVIDTVGFGLVLALLACDGSGT